MPRQRRILKYATGDMVPNDSEYLSTVTQTTREDAPGLSRSCWFVWHYYAVWTYETMLEAAAAEREGHAERADA